MLNPIENQTSHFNVAEMAELIKKSAVEGYELKTYLASIAFQGMDAIFVINFEQYCFTCILYI